MLNARDPHRFKKKRKEKKSKRGTTDVNRFVIMNFSSLIAKIFFLILAIKEIQVYKLKF